MKCVIGLQCKICTTALIFLHVERQATNRSWVFGICDAKTEISYRKSSFKFEKYFYTLPSSYIKTFWAKYQVRRYDCSTAHIIIRIMLKWVLLLLLLRFRWHQLSCGISSLSFGRSLCFSFGRLSVRLFVEHFFKRLQTKSMLRLHPEIRFSRSTGSRSVAPLLRLRKVDGRRKLSRDSARSRPGMHFDRDAAAILLWRHRKMQWRTRMQVRQEKLCLCINPSMAVSWSMHLLIP